MAPLLPVWLLCSAAAWAPLLIAGGARASAPDAAALLREGDAAFARGEFSGSIRHYTDAIEADPKQALFFTKRAAAYMSLRQHSSALRDLNAAIAADSGFTQGYLHRGKLQRWGRGGAQGGLGAGRGAAQLEATGAAALGAWLAVQREWSAGTHGWCGGVQLSLMVAAACVRT